MKKIFDKKYLELQSLLNDRIASRESVTIIKAPPGSGKTYLLVELIDFALRNNLRVAVATQTNAQGDEVCDRLVRKGLAQSLVRFVSGKSDFQSADYMVTADKNQLPTGSCVVVGTSAKWALIDLPQPFDFLFIEEAWQLKTADFLPLTRVAPNFLLIGDPGQIPPVVTLDTSRWSSTLLPPHIAAPEVLIRSTPSRIVTSTFELPATRRLPFDSVDAVRAFYDFNFGAYVEPMERALKFQKSWSGINPRIAEALEAHSIVGVNLPTEKHGPPFGEDRALVNVAMKTIENLLASSTSTIDSGTSSNLLPSDIGIAATHRSMVQEAYAQLPSNLREHIKIDTAERWQGLERKIMIAIHPLTSVSNPSAFDLDTGRLCVMASRHKFGLIVLGRDHIPETIDAFDPPADQALGLPDHSGRGHYSNRKFIFDLLASNRWLKAA